MSFHRFEWVNYPLVKEKVVWIENVFVDFLKVKNHEIFVNKARMMEPMSLSNQR